jgi:hypothetical protein
MSSPILRADSFDSLIIPLLSPSLAYLAIRARSN